MSDQILGFLPISQILPNPEQPRTEFDQEELMKLSNSILEHGVLNPVAVSGPYQSDGSEYYTLIDGERRLRAAKLAGLDSIPALVHQPKKNQDNLLLAMVGNLQRSDLNPIEEGAAYKRLLELGYNVSAICRMVGKSYPTVDMRLKLLLFEPAIQDLFAAGKLPLDNRSITSLQVLPDNIRVKAARKFAADGATARRIETSCNRLINKKNLYRWTPQKHFDKNSIPSVELSGASAIPAFDVLSQRGEMPSWKLIEEAARGTCDDCLVRDSASLENCKDCGAVDLLNRLIKLAK